jgi:hypothetical protein
LPGTLESEAQIGWLVMLCGYWSTGWQWQYKRLYQVPVDKNRKQKNKQLYEIAQRQKKIIQMMWHSMILLWTKRNKEKHGWDKESRDSAQHEVLHKELKEIYLHRLLCDPIPTTTPQIIQNAHTRNSDENSQLARCIVRGNFCCNLVSGLINLLA